MADNGGIKIIKYFTQKLKSFFFSKDILSFLLFLALSAVFWFVHALGKERETTLLVPIHYIGVPVNVAITNSPPREIQISVKDQGLQLLAYSKGKMPPLIIDLSRTFYNKGKILITPDQLSGRVGRYMHLQSTTSILEVHPDSILIQYEKLCEKNLPVELVSSIELYDQYMLSDKISINPSRVDVYGPKHILDTMKSVRTELVQYKDLKDTISTTCRLKPVKMLRYSTNSIKLNIFVEAFTERKVQIPITSINCPPNLSIRTFPAFVIATYTVGLSYFRILNPNDFEVYLDYNDLKSNIQSKQNLRIKNNVSYISNIRISPQEVEFILEQK